MATPAVADQSQLSWMANFIRGIPDGVLCALYLRGKYRDVVLPMTVIRRLDAVLKPTRQAVRDTKARLDAAGSANREAPLGGECDEIETADDRSMDLAGPQT